MEALVFGAIATIDLTSLEQGQLGDAPRHVPSRRADQVRKEARENLNAGADFLKLFVTGGVSSTRGGGITKASYSREEIRAGVEEAERAGTYVAAHAIVASGVRLTVGTDSMHGLLPFEIQRLVDWGAAPNDALLAATRWAAACCRVEDRTGTLEPGKAADLITVAGNPLEEIAAIERTRLVLQAGRRCDRPAAGAGLAA